MNSSNSVTDPAHIHHALTDDLISIVGLDYHYQYVNDAYLRALQLSRENIVGQHVAELLGQDVFQEWVKPHLDKCFAGNDVRYRNEFNFKGHPKTRFMDVNYRPHKDTSSNVIGALVSVHDVTDFQDRELRLQQLAHVDPLTLLPNRQHITLLLSKAMAHALRDQRGFSIGYCDIDQFKAINDNHGHLAGDAVLKKLAQRLLMVIRRYEHLGRLSGDEFLMVFNSEIDDSQQQLIRERLKHALSAPITFEGQTFQLQVSLGFAHYPSDGHTMKALVHHADQQMYCVKKAARPKVPRS